MWEPFLARVKELIVSGSPHSIAWTQAGLDVLRRQSKHTAIPRFSEMFIREVWELQPRLEQPKPRQVPALAAHPRFRAGFDFLLMREQTGDTSVGTMGQWWHDYQTLSNDQRERAIADLNRLQQRLQRQRKTNDQETAQATPLNAVIQNAQPETATDGTATPAAALDLTTKSKRTRTRKAKNASNEQALDALEAQVHAAAVFDQTASNKASVEIEQIQLLPSDDPAMIHANLRAKRRSPNHRNDRTSGSGGEVERRSIAPRQRQPRSKPLQIEPTVALSDTPTLAPQQEVAS